MAGLHREDEPQTMLWVTWHSQLWSNLTQSKAMLYCFNTPQPSHLLTQGNAQEDELRAEGTSTVELSGGSRAPKPFLTPRNNFKICLYCKINPVHAMGFDTQR